MFNLLFIFNTEEAVNILTNEIDGATSRLPTGDVGAA